MTVVSLAPGGDHRQQLALHQEAEAILGTAATQGWLNLLFADGVGLPRWFWGTLPGKKTISLGRLAVALDAAPGREDQPLYAQTEAFAAFLEKLQIQKRGKVDKAPAIALRELAAAKSNPVMAVAGESLDGAAKPSKRGPYEAKLVKLVYLLDTVSSATFKDAHGKRLSVRKLEAIIRKYWAQPHHSLGSNPPPLPSSAALRPAIGDAFKTLDAREKRTQRGGA